MELPQELLWGVDIAVKKLRPGASFGLGGSMITDWIDPEGREPPTWDEIKAQMDQDKAVAEKWLEENKDIALIQDLR